MSKCWKTATLVSTLAFNISLAHASSLTTIYTFGSQGANDGTAPVGTLLVLNNQIYGTTKYGGTHRNGTVFAITPGASQPETFSFSFSGANGKAPFAGLTAAPDIFYGTTTTGGNYACDGGCGTIFSYVPNASAPVSLYQFTGAATNGEFPNGNLVYLNGILYGTTERGGSQNCYARAGCGTIFSYNIATKAFAIVHSFLGGTDGLSPQSNLVNVGNVLYGTTFTGGGTGCFARLGCGSAFKVDLTGATPVYTFIHGFSGGADGANPEGELVAIGTTVYGTTNSGGAGQGCGEGCGTVFTIDTTNAAGGYAKLVSFARSVNGANPTGGVTAAPTAGITTPLYLYGATQSGTSNTDRGEIYQVDITNKAIAPEGVFTGLNGAYPIGGMTYAGGGSFYGTTSAQGGAPTDGGTVFEFTP